MEPGLQIEDGRASDAPVNRPASIATLKVTRVAHSCTLLDFGGSVFLADPWFSEKFGYHRGERLGLRPVQLPRLSGVLVSHAHYDHNDVAALVGTVDKSTPLIVEMGAVKSARKAGFANISPLAACDSISVGPATVTATPAKHGVPEIGFVLQTRGFTVYFGGDTLAIPELSEIPGRFPHIDVAILPINGLRVFGKQVAMNPVEAGKLCATLRPAVVIPTHYAFNGGITDLFMLRYYAQQVQLPDIFRQAVKRYAPTVHPVVLSPGESFALNAASCGESVNG